MQSIKALKTLPLTDQVAAVSCGLYEGAAVLDLDYAEDSSAQTDANFVLTGRGGLVEIQSTAEEEPFQRDQFNAMMDLAEKGISELVRAQHQALFNLN